MMQMTDNEKMDNKMRWVSIIIMFFVWYLLRNDRMFPLYGMSIQIVTLGSMEWFYICHWFGKAPITILQFIGIMAPMCGITILANMVSILHNWIAFILFLGIDFVLTIAIQLLDKEVRQQLRSSSIVKRYCPKLFM